jgi:hypothetical protein
MNSRKFLQFYKKRVLDTIDEIEPTDIPLRRADQNDYRAIDLKERLESLDAEGVDKEQLVEEVREIADIDSDIDEAEYRQHYMNALGDATEGIAVDDTNGVVRCTECNAELDINLHTGEVTLSNAMSDETRSYAEQLRGGGFGTVIKEGITEELNTTTVKRQSN